MTVREPVLPLTWPWQYQDWSFGAYRRPMSELGDFLQARRAARTPEEAGFAANGRRRTAGLRREELAVLSGVSVDYLVRLEQGRQREPSAEVLVALARALGLSADARGHLFALASRRDPAAAAPLTSAVTPALRRLVTASSPAPAWVLDRRCDIVLWNEAAEALFGDLGTPGAGERNYLSLVFGSDGPHWVEPSLVRRDAVAHFRLATTGLRQRPEVQSLVTELSAMSAEFAGLWAAHDVTAACSRRRDVQHDQAGQLAFDVAALRAADGALLLVVLEPRTDETLLTWQAHLDSLPVPSRELGRSAEESAAQAAFGGEQADQAQAGQNGSMAQQVQAQLGQHDAADQRYPVVER